MTVSVYRVPVTFRQKGFIEVVAEDEDAAKLQIYQSLMGHFDSDFEVYDESTEVGTPIELEPEEEEMAQ